MILSCGCRSEHDGIFCEWDAYSRECEDAVAYGCICASCVIALNARPIEKEKRMKPTELADYLDQNVEAEFACEQAHIDEAATMLRQQQKEIEALKEALLKVVTISDRKHDAWDRAKELLEAKRMVAYNIGYEDAMKAAKQ